MNRYIIQKAYPLQKEDADIEISNERLLYVEMDNGHGLQCSFDGDTEQYKQILNKCQQIATLIKEIDELNNTSDSLVK